MNSTRWIVAMATLLSAALPAQAFAQTAVVSPDLHHVVVLTEPVVGRVPVNAKVDLTVRVVDVSAAPVAGVALTLASATGHSVSRTGCASGLSATTDVTGLAVFTICPTTSGAWVASGSGVVASTPYLVLLPPAPTQVSAGRFHSCGRMADGSVVCAGQNNFGEVGSGVAQFPIYRPTKVPGLTGVASVAAGGNFTCALSSPGASGKVKCWGGGASGQIGNGARIIAQLSPRQVMVTATAPLNGVASISVGDRTACAVVNPGLSGTAWCWGENSSAQAGDGTVLDKTRPSPVKVNATTVLKGVSRVAVGLVSTCALLVNGSVRCWGGNNVGQLGNGTTAGNRYASKVVVGIDGVKAKATGVAVGWGNGCARMTTGTVRCWGANYTGQLAQGPSNGSGLFSTVPVTAKVGPTTVLTGVTALSLGDVFMCVIVGTGTAARMRCWGNNPNGGLGVGDQLARRFATLVPSAALNGVKGISLGGVAIAMVPSSSRGPVVYYGWGGPYPAATLGEPTISNWLRPSLMSLW